MTYLLALTDDPTQAAVVGSALLTAGVLRLHTAIFGPPCRAALVSDTTLDVRHRHG